MSVRTLRYNTMNQHITKSALASTDRDALAFLEAAQVYNTNQQRAIVNLVRSLKRVGLWSKMKAIYPFVGGTASAHKWNLKDPRDSDAAFRLSFSGGWTHSSSGALGNGSNTFANTFLSPFSSLTWDSAHISAYSGNDTSAAASEQVLIGATGPNLTQRIFIDLTNFSGFTESVVATINTAFAGTNDWVSWSETDTRGMFIVSRRASNDFEGYKNSDSKNTNTSNFTSSLGNRNLYIGAANSNNGAVVPAQNIIAFATIGDGLTDTDATNLYNIVDLYQKRLGRAV